ncbi:cell envelope integrity protein TolA [Salmonella enterica]|nr:cell envelope integrity protein TolA [Salmonella enterica]EEH5466707.1 cell envelope integrity protein TolA [Salmonella enterica]EEH7556027.1 cell envelope integrity protein TolA [Salmonella enterica]EEO5640224.1 cell envelope integrity protein TolA [Salmonella enterica]EEQ0204196.1 cell envelope integrity protein TolA [Salmonella enterica]
MMGSKTFKLLPFCLLLLANQSFAEGGGVSGADISNYAGVIRKTIENRGGGIFDTYKGRQCIVRIHLARDGTLTGVNIEGGAPDLCNKALEIINEIKKFPEPPSDAIYQVLKDASLDFKP